MAKDDESNSIESYVERISALQSSTRELNQEIGRLRQDAKLNGVDLEALAFVSNMRSRFPNDYGAKILDSIIVYADSTGVEFERNPIKMETAAVEESAVQQPQTAQERYANEYVVETEEKEASFLTQLLVGLGITTLMLWLLI